jgi:hypothetical protein
MKIFAIRDEADKEQKNLAYLLYYETEKLFYIELPKEIQNRFFLRIEDIIPLEDYHLLVFFRNGKVKKCSLRERFQ